MKKITLFLAGALTLLAFSCKSAPTQKEVDDAFLKVYDTYANAIILDGATTYTIQSGDTLTKITKDAYGSDKGYYFPMIMLASKDVILDPDLIEPGMKLTIPDYEKNVNDPTVKPKLKSFFKDVAGVYKKKGTDVAKATYDALLDISDNM